MKKIFQLILSRHLRSLGEIICSHPTHFVVLPCIVSALLGTGLMRITYERDIENLGIYNEGRAMQSKRLVEKLFPMNTSEFTSDLRMTDNSFILAIHLLDKNGGNVLNKDCFEEIEIVDKAIKNVSITFNGRTINYHEVCAKVNGKCYESSASSLLADKKLLLNKRIKMKYPIDFNSLTFHYKIYASSVGGVTLDKTDKFIEEAKVIRAFYIPDFSNKTKQAIANTWLNAVISKLNLMTFSHINVMPFAFSLVTEEVKGIVHTILPLISVVIVIIGIFSFITSLTGNWVTSKPWLGVVACISAGLALLSSFGLTFYFGVPSTDFNIGIPFLILGTEVDDAYVLISTWRKTDSRESVRKRMGDTFAEAGVSITITSITNVISFSVGIMAPFLGVKYFCIHAAIALAFTYFYMITFFGSFMAIDGFREKNERNAVTFRKCSSLEQDVIKNKEEIATMKFFKDVIGNNLQKPSVKAIVIIVFVANFSTGFYGLSQLKDGLELENLLTPDSLATESVHIYYRYFSNFYGILQVVVDEPINYTNPKTQKSLNEMFQKFWSHPNMGDNTLTMSWLRGYQMFQDSAVSKFSLAGYNLTEEQDFINGLLDVFLKFPISRQFKHDILFNENYTKIVSSRFMLPILNVNNRADRYKILKEFQSIADECKLNVVVHSIFFPLFEQGLIIRKIVFQLVWITSLLSFVVFFAFVPNILTALVVAVSVVSALIETLGYMALWNVKLDMISSTVLILSVGFSVNYPAHAACAFSLAKAKNANEKMKESLYLVGLPIFQGSLSTILGSSLLIAKNTYACRTFPKLMFLVSIQTAFHAMFVLPVALSLVTHYTRGWNLKRLNTTSHKKREPAEK